MAATTDRAAFVKYDRTLGSASDEDRGFYYPVDACLSPDGRIYGLSRSHEASTKSIRVCVLDLDSEFYGVFGSIGEGDGQFTWPTSLARDSEGRVYVGDEYLDRISVFDDVGNYLGKWGVHGSEPGMLDGPCGLAFDANDDLYVSDHRNHRIQKFTSDGRYIAHFGREGSGSGQFNLPWGLTVALGGDVYVADWRNDRVQRFTPDGELVAIYGCSGGGDGQLSRPAGVAVDPEDYLYVADWGNERVQIFDPDGAFVMKLRGEATMSPWGQEFLDANPDEARTRKTADLRKAVNIRGDGEHERSSHIEHLFWGPTAVRLDGKGRLYVVDRNRHRIQVYART